VAAGGASICETMGGLLLLHPAGAGRLAATACGRAMVWRIEASSARAGGASSRGGCCALPGVAERLAGRSTASVLPGFLLLFASSPAARPLRLSASSAGRPLRAAPQRPVPLACRLRLRKCSPGDRPLVAGLPLQAAWCLPVSYIEQTSTQPHTTQEVACSAECRHG